jgi:hypothetical protein
MLRHQLFVPNFHFRKITTFEISILEMLCPLFFPFGDCPKTFLNAINVTYVRNVLSVIQAKIWPKKHVIRPKRGNQQKRQKQF